MNNFLKNQHLHILKLGFLSFLLFILGCNEDNNADAVSSLPFSNIITSPDSLSSDDNSSPQIKPFHFIDYNADHVIQFEEFYRSNPEGSQEAVQFFFERWDLNKDKKLQPIEVLGKTANFPTSLQEELKKR